jgi:hypothetical protein
MKNILPLLAVVLIIVSCKSQQPKSLSIFNDISFKLLDGDEVVDIDSSKKETFKSYVTYKYIQVPLFRCIESDFYSIYIGIPLNSSIKKLYKDTMPNTIDLKLIVSETDSSSYFYKSYNHSSAKIYLYSENFENNIVYVLVRTNGDMDDSTFTMQSLASRFKK